MIDYKDINSPKPRQRDTYTKYKMCHSTMMVIYIRQHLSNIEVQVTKS